MAGCVNGQTLVIEPGVGDVSKTEYVNHWKIYLTTNTVENPVAIEEIEIIPVDPVEDEGDQTFDFSYEYLVDGFTSGDIFSLRFEPSGAQSDLAGTLDWNSDEFTVASTVLPISGTLNIVEDSGNLDKLLYVYDWKVHINVNGVRSNDPVDEIKAIVVDPVGDEGDQVFSVSYNALVTEDLNVGDIVKWEFVPSGTSSDFAGILDWETDEYVITGAIITQFTHLSLCLCVGI